MSYHFYNSKKFIMKISFLVFVLVVCCLIQQGVLTEYSGTETVKNLKIQKVQDTQTYGYDHDPSLKSSNLATIGAIIPPADYSLLMKNIEAIDFRRYDDTYCCGSINITNFTMVSQVIKSNGTTVMVVSSYGQGRAVVLASHLLFQEQILANNKNWVFLLRNAIRYAAKTTYAKYEILAVGLEPSRSFKQLLNRSGLVANITFVWDLLDFSALNKTQFQVVLIGEFSLEYLNSTDFQKITQYVANGGGIITTFRPECLGCYLQQASCSQLNKKCLHNTFLTPMGIRFNDSDITPLSILQYNITDKMNMTNKFIRKYQKKNVTTPIITSIFYNDYNTIVNGVPNVSFIDSRFSSFFYSMQSYFPVIINQNKQSILVGGRFGLGKLIFSGDLAIFQKTQAANIKLFSNILKWLTGNKTSFKVGFLFDGKIGDYTIFQKMTGNITKSSVFSAADLQGKDIICVTYYQNWPTNLTTAMLTALKTYVQNGGNLLFGSIGWAWAPYGEGSRNPNLTYEDNFANYVIGKQFDIYLRPTERQQDYYVILQNVRQTDIENFLKNDLIRALKNQTSFSVNNDKVDQYISRIQNARNLSNICDLTFYHTIIDTLVQSRYNIQLNLDLSPNDPFSQRIYKIIQALSYLVSPYECRPLPPSLNQFPGWASKIVPNKTISVYKNRNQRTYTGLYMNPGQPIRITHNISINNLVDVTLVINHGDNLLQTWKDNGNLSRYGNVVKQFKISNKNMTIASPHGGIIFFSVQNWNNLTTPLVFQIFNAYEAPYFNENMHNAAQFAVIRQIDAPLFVFQTKKFVLIGPTKGIFGSVIINLKRLCKFWNKVVKIFKQYRGFSLTPFQKDSIYTDVNIRGGYMHAGNPIMTFCDITFLFLGYKNTLFTKGHRIYHQFGHNHQDTKWRTQPIKQITTQIYVLYLLQAMNGVGISTWLNNFNSSGDLASFESQLNKGKDGRDHTLFDLNYRVGTYFYFILIDDFGFQLFSTLHRKYDTFNFYPENDTIKYDLFVEQLSLVVQQNLWDYFSNWDYPVTEASKSKISHLPKYYCTRHPQLTP